jgi:hypothetical protein
MMVRLLQYFTTTVSRQHRMKFSMQEELSIVTLPLYGVLMYVVVKLYVSYFVPLSVSLHKGRQTTKTIDFNA